MITIKKFEDKEYFKNLQKSKLLLLKFQDELKKYDSDKRKKKKYEKVKYIIENFRTKSIEEISKKTGYNHFTIKIYAREYGLNSLFLKENEMTFNSFFYMITSKQCNSKYTIDLLLKHGIPIYKQNNWNIINLNEFFEWYKKHIKLIRVNFYKEGSLPIEPNWFLEKVGADKRAVEYTYKRKWSEKEDLLLKQFVKERKTYKEISFILKRTGPAIKRRCFDLKIDKPKRNNRKYWTDKQVTKLKELWLKGYEPCIIAEEIDRGDREIISYLERFNYFGLRPEKFVN